MYEAVLVYMARQRAELSTKKIAASLNTKIEN